MGSAPLVLLCWVGNPVFSRLGNLKLVLKYTKNSINSIFLYQLIEPMDYHLIKQVVELVEVFDTGSGTTAYPKNIAGFKRWICDNERGKGISRSEPGWEGKEKGRTPESVISTLLVHMNRYAKTYSKAAIQDSVFSTQEDFIYLINLKAFGAMTKIELIKKNIQDKPTGMQIINRLINSGWAIQKDSKTDKRSKVIKITAEGLKVLARQMDKIRLATRIVTGNLSHDEKMELIRLLTKLNDFHHPIFSQQFDSAVLLEQVSDGYLQTAKQVK
jgi:DNA-binding MarR family transcriptional regulator